MQLVLFNPWIGSYQVLPFRARVDLGAMAMKGAPYSLKPQHHWNLTIRLFSFISRTLIGGGLTLCRGAVGVFYSHSRLGKYIFECACMCVCVCVCELLFRSILIPTVNIYLLASISLLLSLFLSPYIYIYTLHSKQIVFLINAQPTLNPLCNHTLYTAIGKMAIWQFETALQHGFIRISYRLIFKKCWDSYRPRKRGFPQSN